MMRSARIVILVVLAVFLLCICTTVVKVLETATTSPRSSTTVTTATTLSVTVAVHIPDANGPEPPPEVAPNTQCSFALNDDEVAVYGPDNTVLASAIIPPEHLLFPGNAGRTSPYQCFSTVKVSLRTNRTTRSRCPMVGQRLS